MNPESARTVDIAERQVALRITTRVRPGHKIEVTALELIEGEAVEVFLTLTRQAEAPRRSALEIIESLHGHRLFQTAADVDCHLQEERDSWQRLVPKSGGSEMNLESAKMTDIAERQVALHITARVQPGHKIEISVPEVIEGETVEVFLVLPRKPAAPRLSMLEFLDSLPPGPRSAPTWEEIERHFQEERASWDR